jgi:PAS domain-containing protein
MPNVSFDRQVDQFRKQIDALIPIQSGENIRFTGVADVVYQGQLSSLEELSVAGEELHAQNEELLAAREELEKERNRYVDLFQSALDGYLVMSLDRTILEANQAACLLLRAPVGADLRRIDGRFRG